MRGVSRLRRHLLFTHLSRAKVHGQCFMSLPELTRRTTGGSFLSEKCKSLSSAREYQEKGDSSLISTKRFSPGTQHALTVGYCVSGTDTNPKR